MYQSLYEILLPTLTCSHEQICCSNLAFDFDFGISRKSSPLKPCDDGKASQKGFESHVNDGGNLSSYGSLPI